MSFDPTTGAALGSILPHDRDPAKVLVIDSDEDPDALANRLARLRITPQGRLIETEVAAEQAEAEGGVVRK